MVPRGLEPRTLRLLAVRSNQLSYETVVLAAVCRMCLSALLLGGIPLQVCNAQRFGHILRAVLWAHAILSPVVVRGTCGEAQRFAAARLAQPAERKALNLVVVGSSPTVGVFEISWL